MILIIGAGIAGLSAAYHLKGEEYIVIEREPDVGGLCRSKEIDGFFFDYTGHLLHSRDRSFAAFLDEYYRDTFSRHERRSSVYSHGVYTPFPFQIHTYGLPLDVIFDCLHGFVGARLEAERKRSYTQGREITYKEWILGNFGEGFARHFFFPFNEKLYCRDLDEMSAEWTEWSIPIPSLEDVVAGSIGIRKTGVGYNPMFLYPRAGGIDVLPRRMASLCTGIHLNAEIDSIDCMRKEAHVKGGDLIRYDFIISTIPLKRFLALCTGMSAEIAEAGKHLTYVKVVDVNIGFEGMLDHDHHWVYVPEKGFPFYRVGFPTNFSKSVAPKGCSSLYAEVSLREENNEDIHVVAEKVIESLIRMKILKDESTIVVKDANLIDPAYVVFDPFRRKNLPKIISSLSRMGIVTAGRFGSWDYLPMEGAFLEGKKAARTILSLRG